MKPVFRGRPHVKPTPFSKAGRSQTPQNLGRRKEKDLARKTGGDLQPGSGCFPGKGGDVRTPRFLIEHKFTTALSYAITIKTLRKIKREAEHQLKTPALVLELSGGFMYQPEKWALIPYDVFEELLESGKEETRRG